MEIISEELESKKRVHEQLKSKDLEITKIKSEFDASIGAKIAQLEMHKLDLKQRFIFSNTKKIFLECLDKNIEEWPKLDDADTALKESSKNLKEIKKEVIEEKTVIQSLCETAEEAFNLLQSRIKCAEEKIQEVEDKKSQLLDKLQSQNAARQKAAHAGLSPDCHPDEVYNDMKEKLQSTELAVVKCQSAINQTKLEVQKLKSRAAELQQFLDEQKLTLALKQKENQLLVTHNSKLWNSLNNMCEDLEQLGGVRVHLIGWDKACLEFLQSNEHSNLCLELTLEFYENNFGNPVLRSGEVNIDSLKAEDLILEALASNDIPSLVTRLKSRWLSHLPLLSEITDLRKRFAIDWIQEEKCLRIMVGEGGGIVCALNVPATYPLSGEVTLIDVKRSASHIDFSSLQPPANGSTLRDWAGFLEETFGRP